MVENFQGSGHSIFRGIGALNWGILQRNSGTSTIHFTAVSWNFDLLFRTVHSANQLGIYGAEKVVWRFSSKDSWSTSFACGQISFESERSAVSKAGAARSGFLGIHSEEDWGSSVTPLVCLSSRIWSTGTRSSIHPNLGVCGILQTSLCWNALQHCSWCGWVAMIQDLKSNFGSKVILELAPFFKSRPPVILTSAESTFRSPPCQETVPNLGLLKPLRGRVTIIILQKFLN